MRLKCAACVQAERSELEIYPARLFVERVQVAKDDYYVRKVVGRLAVAHHRRIIRLMKTQIGIALQRRILAADPVDAGDEILQAPGTLQVPVLQFVFLGVEVLFATGFPGGVFTTLECWPVYPVVCPQRGGKN